MIYKTKDKEKSRRVFGDLGNNNKLRKKEQENSQNVEKLNNKKVYEIQEKEYMKPYDKGSSYLITKLKNIDNYPSTVYENQDYIQKETQKMLFGLNKLNSSVNNLFNDSTYKLISNYKNEELSAFEDDLSDKFELYNDESLFVLPGK